MQRRADSPQRAEGQGAVSCHSLYHYEQVGSTFRQLEVEQLFKVYQQHCRYCKLCLLFRHLFTYEFFLNYYKIFGEIFQQVGSTFKQLKVEQISKVYRLHFRHLFIYEFILNYYDILEKYSKKLAAPSYLKYMLQIQTVVLG